MKIIKFLGLAIVITVISACAGNKDSDNNNATVSVDSSGNCSAAFIADYNNIIYATRILKDYYKRKSTDSEIFRQAESVKNACEQFYAKHDNVTCMAEIDNDETSISNAKVKPNCEAAQQILDLKKN